MMKSRAVSRFSIRWACTRGFLLYLPTFFWESTSSRVMSLIPSLKSVARSSISAPCFFKCSLHHLQHSTAWIHSTAMLASYVKCQIAICPIWMPGIHFLAESLTLWRSSSVCASTLHRGQPVKACRPRDLAQQPCIVQTQPMNVVYECKTKLSRHTS